MEISTEAETETLENLSPADHRSVALSKPLIITALILATALSALDGTIVATALPTIVGVLGGLPLYPLVVSSFLLTATTTVPLYGRLSDMYGRKTVFMFGSGIFIAGSALCGLAWDMPSLIAFRALQGLGAGAVLPVSLTIIGDLFEIEERARLQGVFSAVWGISSVVGPLVGGAIVQFFDWRWVFFINLPVGIVSSLLFFFYLREPRIHSHQRVDIMGAITLTIGAGLALVGLQLLSRGGPPASVTLAVWGGAALLLVAFVLIERRASAPILSLALLSRPVILVPCMAGLLAGAVLVGVSAYIPLLVQGAWGGTPIEAGLIVAPLSIGWPVASTLSGRLIRNFGYRPLVLGGMAFIVAGAALLLAIGLPGISSSVPLKAVIIIIAMLISGFGLGLNATSMLIAVQISVPWSSRGMATAALQFFRNMGQSVGAAALGGVLTATLASLLASPGLQAAVSRLPPAVLKAGADPALGPVNTLFDLSLRDTVPAPIRSALEEALSGSLWWVYFAIAIMAVAGTLISTRFPREVERKE